MIRQDGAVVWVRDSSGPVLDPDGRAYAWQGIYQDITEQHLAEEALRAAETRYRTLVEQLPAITFIDRVDPDRPEQAIPEYISPQVQEVLGYTPEEFLDTEDEWAGALHPDDRDETLRCAEEAQRTGVPFVAEYRMIRKDGRVVWIDERSVLLRDADGRPEMWQGIMQDVTANKRADRALRASERRFRAMFDGAAIGIARLSLDGTALEVNDAMAELLGTTRKDLVGNHIGTFLADSKTGEVPEEYRRLAEGALDRYEADRPYIRRSGEELWCHATVSLVRDEEGRPDFAIAMLEDITARKAAEDELGRRAMHDALTGLPNRDLLMDRMGVALARLERGGAGLAVMFLDLDRFKLVNDEFGHEAGDRVLAEVARRFAASLRPADTVARYGGDEFVVLCQDLWSAPDAVATAERLCRCLDDPIALPEGVTAKVGVSIGVTLALDGVRYGEKLIREADTAMYRAKQGGRGGVAIAGDETILILDRPD
jgi:diguanylate cyclase (GGDEF)-like protein/PAS domain S-box-containing protein